MSNYRYMRSMLMFDLPVTTASKAREYRRFVKYLKSIGFVMFQESIYIKLNINEAAVKNMEKSIRSKLPREGFVAMLTITEKQFASMSYLLGTYETDIVDNDSRYIEL